LKFKGYKTKKTEAWSHYKSIDGKTNMELVLNK
jgi:hypothetical protein